MIRLCICRALGCLNHCIKKYNEVLLYLFFGVLTTVVSIGSYAFFNVALGINELIATYLPDSLHDRN